MRPCASVAKKRRGARTEMAGVSKTHVLDGIARLHALMMACPDLRSVDGLMMRTALMEITARVNAGPVLLLTWTPEPPRPDAKMRAANDLIL